MSTESQPAGFVSGDKRVCPNCSGTMRWRWNLDNIMIPSRFECWDCGHTERA